MLRLRYLLSAACFMFFVIGAQAQTTKISDAAVFTRNPVVLDFTGFADGAKIADVYSRWGVTISGTEGSVPSIIVIPPAVPIGGTPEHQLNRVVRNVGPAGLAKALPLVINFKYPVAKVGFKASNAPTASVNASIVAYDPAGRTLGTVLQTGLNEEKFFGVATTSDRGIAKVAFDFGSVDAGEQIDDLTFEYLSRPPFVTYLTQVADFSDLLQTILVVSNLTNSTAQGEIRLFTFEGATMDLKTNQGENDTFAFDLPPFTSKTISSTGKSTDLKRGYAVIESNVPVEASAIFRVINASGTALQEAGVGAAPSQYQAVTVAQKEGAAGLDTGVAVVNPSTSPADITALLYDEQGGLVAANSDDLDLAPGKQIAKFLTELFPDVQGDFRGTLVINSTEPIAVVTLRTIGGIASSTLPVGSTSR